MSLSSLEEIITLPEMHPLMGERVVVNNEIMSSVSASCESKENNGISERYFRVQLQHIDVEI
jgi:hypothetical protein